MVALPLRPTVDALTLHISCLEGKEDFHGNPRIIDDRDDPLHDTTTAPVQLLEESEYRYEITGLDDGATVRLEPTELFSPDNASHTSGRLFTGRSVGNVSVSVSSDDDPFGRTTFEIRSRKLEYLTDYRWMLEGVSSDVADILLSSFAPANVHLGQDWFKHSQSLYPRFALLNSVLTGDEFDGAIATILSDPHNEYRTFTEQVDPGKGIRGGSDLSRSLTRPGARVDAPGLDMGKVATLPREIDQTRHEESSDTVPNRFVKFALESWRETVGDVLDRIGTSDDDSAHRGVVEAETLLATIDNVLTTPLMRSTGRLEGFPSSNQVLQRRSGYREVFRLFIQADAAAALEWGPTESVFPAGSKDVATLYEYWTYLELAKIVESLGFGIDKSALISVSDNGLVLNLNQGSTPVVKGSGQAAGREMTVELYYNKSFRRGSGTWTRTVRPDCSIRFNLSDSLSPATDVWVHFDAKYRIHDVSEAFGGSDDENQKGTSGSQTERGALSDDLMKMHTYRDAITRTAGSYVLYPGDIVGAEKSRFEKYQEVLPGLGAFAMRPVSDGHTASAQSQVLADFLADVIRYMASRGTAFERSDFWQQRSYDETAPVVEPTSLLTEPPADTAVLLGYVKDDDHWAWIVNEGEYNLRADDREGAVDMASDMLRAQFLLAYSFDGSTPRLFRLGGRIAVLSAEDLLRSGYINPRGNRYACLNIDRELNMSPDMTVETIESIRDHVAGSAVVGAPVLARWSDVFARTRGT